MKFINPNIYFAEIGFWIRWTLIAFIIIIVAVIAIGFFKRLKVDFEKLKVSGKKNLLLLLVYLSTIPIYIFRDFLGDCGNSVIYKVAESLNNIESLVIVVIVGTFIYGCMYKNFHTFINFYIKVLATLELTYIIAYYITNQVALEWWFNWMGVFLLGIVFILLYIIEIKAPPTPTSTSFTNPYNAINEYDNLYSLRKYQADNIISIIKSKISDSGYSICINGEWGSGKTSLINGVMDKVRDDTKVNVYEIRINAMELDNSTAMLKYLFAQIEDILKINEVYVGLASEYRDLISSVSGTIIHESIGGFVSKKLNVSNDDYRKNLKRLGDLLTESLKNSKIVIIIDDIERCSEEKAKSYLFLIKEIATLNCCLTIFLANIHELKCICKLNDNFFEKFFDEIITLFNVNYEEMFFNNELLVEIQKIVEKYDEKFNEEEKERYLYIPNENERTEIKNSKLKAIKENKRLFLECFENPRRVNKINGFYTREIKIIENIKKGEEKVEDFINKVDYKKQLFLLSIMYGVFTSKFYILQSKGIYEYVTNIILKKEEENKDGFMKSLLEDEWFTYLAPNDYIINEKLRFVDYVLTKAAKLPEIANGYTSIEEEHLDMLDRDEWPENQEFPDIVLTVYHATNNDFKKREKLLRKVFCLYKNRIEYNCVDEAFGLFESNELKNYIKFNSPILKMFFNTFCDKSCELIDAEKLLDSFIYFSSIYLWRNISALSRFFVPVSLPEFVHSEAWNNASESFLNKKICDDMINQYCEKCEKYLKISNDNIVNKKPIDRLQEIIEKVNKRYGELGMSDCFDIVQGYEDIKKLMSEIQYLFKIEEFINKCNLEANTKSLNAKDISIGNVASFIDKLHDEVCKNITNVGSEEIQNTLQFLYNSELHITDEEYNKLNNIVTKYFEANGGSVAVWRHMLVYLKENKIQQIKVNPDN